MDTPLRKKRKISQPARAASPAWAELAYNLWWSWHPAARMLFKKLDRMAWKDTGHNPVKLLTVLPPKSWRPRPATRNICATMTRSWPNSAGTGDPGLLVHGKHHRRRVRPHRLFLPGVRPAPLPAVLRRGPGFSGRGPSQGVQRPGDPPGGRGFHVSGRLRPPEDQCRRLAGRTGRGPGSGRRAHHPGAGRPGRAAGGPGALHRPAHPRGGLAGDGRPHPALPDGYRPGDQRPGPPAASPTISISATWSSACSRKSSWGSAAAKCWPTWASSIRCCT